MKRLAGWAIITTLWLAGASTTNAGTHVVGPEQVRTALSEHSQQRASDLAALDALLSTPTADSAADQLGVDLESTRTALRSLTDSELRDLASRAAQVKQDPAAGLSYDVEQLLIIFLIVAIVILVLQAID